jgi:hypothetical protein
MISTLADSTEGGRGGETAVAVDAFGIVPLPDPLAAVELETAAAGALFWYHQAAPEAATMPTTATIE